MLTALLALLALAQPQAAPAAAPLPSDAIDSDWRAIPDDELLVFTLANGKRFTVRLAPRYAPVHVANIRTLAAAHWWDASSIYRVQDNYVAQWGDATEEKPLPAGVIAEPPAEYDWAGYDGGTTLAKRDPYAAKAGHSADGWPVATDGTRAWLAHCYGMVGVARGLAPSTGSGGDLYAVIGHAPRHLDRNIAVVGRVIDGIEQLSTLPRGTGTLGFYEREAERVPIVSARLASALPPAERPHFQYRATDNPRFAAWIALREKLQPPFFTVPAGGADICNVQAQVRRAP
jgi:peptidylprolyl isomerase